MGLLTAAGTSICGVTAIVSLAPAIKATEREVETYPSKNRPERIRCSNILTCIPFFSCFLDTLFEVAFAVANVVVFGLCGMLSYPYLAHTLASSSEQVGLFLGSAIHDTSQVRLHRCSHSANIRGKVFRRLPHRIHQQMHSLPSYLR